MTHERTDAMRVRRREQHTVPLTLPDAPTPAAAPPSRCTCRDNRDHCAHCQAVEAALQAEPMPPTPAPIYTPDAPADAPAGADPATPRWLTSRQVCSLF